MSEMKDDLTHSLCGEFPEYRNQIHKLQETDIHFAEKARSYHKLDHQIRGLEDGDVPVTDQVYDDLKLQRVKLKDELFKILTSSK